MVGCKPCRSRHFIELLPSYPSGNLARLGEYVQLSSRSLRADEHKIGRGDCACSLTVFTIPELSVAVVAIALAYIIFSLTGFGSALVAAPLLAHVMPVPIVIPLLAVLDFVAPALRGIHLNKEIARDEIVVLIPAMLVGNAIGAAPIAFPTSIAGISTTISSRAISLFKWIPRSAGATKSNTANKGITIGTGITCARRGAATSADPNPVRLKMIYARAIATTATESSGIVNTVKLQAQSPRPILCSSARNDRLDSWTYSPSRARFPDGYDGSNSIKCLDLQGFHPTMR